MFIQLGLFIYFKTQKKTVSLGTSQSQAVLEISPRLQSIGFVFCNQSLIVYHIDYCNNNSLKVSMLHTVKEPLN